MQGVTVSGYDQANELHEIKDSIPEFKSVGSQVLQNVIERLSGGIQAFFRRIKKGGEKAGFPRFKSWRRYDSFTLKSTGWNLDGRYLSVKNIGRFKMNLSRLIQGNIKTITINRSSTNKWYACFSCNEVPQKLLPQNDKVVGLDVGIKSFLVDSEGNPPVENPKWLKHTLRELRIKQRKLARAIKCSNRRKESKLAVAKVHEKVTNQRNDFQHKLVNEYIRNFGIIVVEKLQIRNMVRNHNLASSIEDCAWGSFFEKLDYKAEEAGRMIIKDNPKQTTQKCHVCGYINKELTLKDREWDCPKCETHHDRDRNAAYNLRDDGIKYLEKQRVGQTHQTLTWDNSSCVV
jgi:putative transposase